MPTYTYLCTACGAHLERRQSFSEAALTVCESCSGALRRVFHPVGVIFKGSGFYNTDYKNAKQNGSSETKDDSSDKPKATDADKSSDQPKSAEAPKSDKTKTDSASSSTVSKSESSSTTAATATKDV